jgi:gamma-glutamyltranspeptidase/glutathione hydrolase
MGFGTGIVPKKCGFSLQNRGAGFSLDPMHPNALQPLKRPYHTIIPCMLTHADESNSLYATMSNMGGFMQPQGHLQLIVAMVECGLDPQASIDLPRFCIGDGTSDGTVYMEEGVESDIITRLKSMGHSIISNVSSYDRRIFGKAQIIMIDRRNQIRWAGSDGRSDGCAVGY